MKQEENAHKTKPDRDNIEDEIIGLISYLYQQILDVM